MYSLIAEYGDKAIAYVLAALLALLVNKLLALIEGKTIRELAGRFASEAFAAVREVGDGYVADLKHYNDDGKLTDDEKKQAKATAIRIAKANFGPKGIKRLARVFDIEKWIGNKIEAFVGDEKRLGKSAPPSPPDHASKR